jgi:cyclase
MLKKRIAATLVIRNGIVVQSIGFNTYLPVGKPAIAVEYLNQWGIDEIILIDISASKNGIGPDNNIIKNISEKCFVPLTVGGGISSLDQMKNLMQSGADKIALNQMAIHRPILIEEAAKVFGNQCIVISIDVIKTDYGYKVYDYIQKTFLSIELTEFVRKMENLGAGEFLINSVDRDGKYLGFDIDLMRLICQNTNIPVIASGGARNALDFIEIFKNTNVSAASAANFFHFLEHSVILTKSRIKKDIDVRLETHSTYEFANLNQDVRLNKIGENELEELLFVRIEKEVI